MAAALSRLLYTIKHDVHSFYLGIIGYPPFSVLRHNPSASEDCFKVSRDQTWEAQHCLRATVLAKSTRICSCSMVATVWTASTKMPTSLSCFGKRQAAVVPLRYMFHAFFFTFVQPQLSLHLNFPMDRDLFLWHQTFLTRKLPSSIFSTINDPTKIKISTLSRRFRFSGTKWRISTRGPGGVFGGHVMWRRRNLHLESQLPSPDFQKESPSVQCTHHPTLFGHLPKEKLSIWHHTFHLEKLQTSVGVYKTNIKHPPSKPSIGA